MRVKHAGWIAGAFLVVLTLGLCYRQFRLPEAPPSPSVSARSLTSAAALPDSPEELDMREATFRYQFTTNASGLRERAGAYYLSIITSDWKDSDPPPELLKRFAGNRPPVKKVSDCSRSLETGVLDKKTGDRGVVFNTGPIKWFSETEAEISGGYYEGGLSASGNTYYLRKVGGKWKVVKEVMHWIS